MNEDFERQCEDNHLKTFRLVCSALTAEMTTQDKRAFLSQYFRHGADGKQFLGNAYLWIKLLATDLHPYKFKHDEKGLIKIFASVLQANEQRMLEAYREGNDLAEIIRENFKRSKLSRPSIKNKLCLKEIDMFCQGLETANTNEELREFFVTFCKLSTPNDMKTVVRILTKKNLIDLNVSDILRAFDTNAYEMYQKAGGNLKLVFESYMSHYQERVINSKERGLILRIFYQIISIFLAMSFFYVFFLFAKETLIAATSSM